MDFQHLAETLIDKLAHNVIVIEWLDKSKVDGRLQTFKTSEQTLYAAVNPYIRDHGTEDHIDASIEVIFSNERLKEEPNTECRVLLNNKAYLVRRAEKKGLLNNEPTCWRLLLKEA